MTKQKRTNTSKGPCSKGIGKSDDLKGIIKKNWWFLLILTFGIPFLIHIAFLLPAPIKLLAAKWSVGDFLMFYGSLLGSSSTIYVIFKTISFTRDNQSRERRLSIMPCLFSKYKLLDINAKQPNFSVFAVCSPKQTQNEVINEYKAVFQTTEDDLEDEAKKADFIEAYLAIEYTIENQGADNAIKVCLEYEAISHAGSMVPFKLQKDSSETLVLVFPAKGWLSDQKKEIMITLSFSYWDVALLSKYKQCETVKLLRDDRGNLKIESECSLCRPKEIIDASVESEF